MIERMMIMSGERICSLDLPEEVLAAPDRPAAQQAGSALKEFRDKSERDFILATLKKNNGNISQSAADVGVGRRICTSG